MASLSDTEAKARSQILASLGSFWFSVFRETDKVRALVALSRLSSSLGDFMSRVHSLAGLHTQGKLKHHVGIRFSPHNVFETGTAFYEEDNGIEYTSKFGEGIIYGHYRINYFGMRLKGITPMVIQARGRKLVLGIDFFIQADRFILFRDDPRILFPDLIYHVTLGIDRNYRSLNNFLTNVQITDYEDMVIRYYRQSQTPKSYTLALAAVGGMQILRKEQKLLEVIPDEPCVRYIFENETLFVDYPHDLLEAGQTYPKDYIIGDGVQVFHEDGTDRAWWRQVDWRGGLSMDVMVQLRGMNLLDQETVAYAAGQDTGSVDGSKVHTRVNLSGDWQQEKAYWEDVASKETLTGHYLNNLLSLPNEVDGGNPNELDTYDKMIEAYEEANELNRILGLPEEAPDVRALPTSKLVNALDVFFQAVLGFKGFVVVIRQDKLKNPSGVMEFLRREMLVGCTPIIFGHGPFVEETVEFGGQVISHDFVVFRSLVPQAFTETIHVGSIATDFVTLRPEIPTP